VEEPTPTSFPTPSPIYAVVIESYRQDGWGAGGWWAHANAFDLEDQNLLAAVGEAAIAQ